MYLAPLNYDRFFKKVFSDINIAKSFLEDFLDETITSIEQLGDKHRVTDDAAIVEFDYRCKIKDKYIIIDMQQWYKPDVVKRFYLYHSLNTGLQLETLGTKYILDQVELKSEKKKQKDYDRVEPVYTLIWMVDDNLHYSGDYAEFSLQHQSVIEFITDEELWFNGDLSEISTRRSEVVGITSNKSKGVNFLSENKLIFMFQKNIVNNMKSNREHEKYGRWFEFAIKTRDKNNIVSDFEDFIKDRTFSEIIRRLRKDSLNADDIKYLESEDENIRLTLDFYQKQNILMSREKEQGIEQGIEQERKVQRKLQLSEQFRNIKNMKNDNFSLDQISKYTGLSINEIKKLENPDD